MKEKHLLYNVYASYIHNETYISKKHMHNYYELYYLISGNRVFQIKDTDYNISSGSLMLVKSYIPHSTRGGKFCRYVVYFNKDFLNLYFNEEYIKKILECFDKKTIKLKKSNQLVAQFEAILRYFNLADYDMFAITLISILTELNRTIEQPVLKNINQKQNGLISNVTSYIGQNYATIQSLDELASHFYVSKFYLTRLFKQVTRISPFSYITNIRIYNAMELLRKSDKSINEIAISCGFNSNTYFCKTFKSSTGITPVEYRKTITTSVNEVKKN